ncbi:MAG: ornithine carbamoyltransferase [Acidimicrobiia bacterium]
MTLRNLLDLDDLTPAEIEVVLDLSEQPAIERVLDGRGVALIFEKPSARTRHSTEMAVVQLGGHPVTTRADEVGLDVRESVEDVTRTMAQYHAALCARVFEHRMLERMAAVDVLPVVNLLSDRSHPLQALADLLTLRQRFGAVQGLRLAWVGDYTNVAASLTIGAAALGASMVVAAPNGYGPPAVAVDRFAESLSVVHRPDAAVKGADAVFTDTWISMGQETSASDRVRAFEGFTVTRDLMSLASTDAVFLHCLPAHRGQEVADDVLDGPQSLVWQEAQNRMHTARGALAFVCGVRA